MTIKRGPVGGAGELTGAFEHWWGTGGWDEPDAAKRAFEAGWEAALERLAAKAPQGVPAAEILYHYCREIIENKNHPSNGVREAYQALLAMVRPSSEGGGLAANPGYPAPESTGGPQKMAALPVPVPVPVSDDTIHHGMVPPMTATQMLDAVVSSLRMYPNGSGDERVMAEVERIVREAAAPKPAPAVDTLREALRCAEYALSHPATSNQDFALNAVRTALEESQ